MLRWVPRNARGVGVACIAFAALLTLLLGRIRATEDPRPQRTFTFTYAGVVTQLSPGQIVRLWLPVPPGNDDQRIERIAQDLPGSPQIHEEPKAHNRLLYVEATARPDGTVPFSVTYRVTRREAAEEPPTPSQEDDTAYLGADALVPVGGKPAQVLLAGQTMPTDSLRAGRVLYDLVGAHLQYRKDQRGWGRGDAGWACDSRFGNCTDFHSLFISLARTWKMPATFEIGFGLPRERGRGEVAGYHCWAKFKPPSHGWVPVDISEAKQDPSRRDYFFGHLCENRVAFSTGRDLMLVPRQDGPPLNFLIYPYAEVDRHPYPADRITRSFHYEDASVKPDAPGTSGDP